ncbi:sensor histidine kinase [Streptomyces longispororuber]|uniref:sensor histidine kinase n=1 Tax=Streptomyces longispororuber TaxID=68230 RepID=UPI0036F7E9C6
MSATPAPPLLKRLSPAAWMALAWCAGSALSLLFRFRLPGESQPSVWPGVLLFRWDGLLTLAAATAVTLLGCVRLERRPLPALALLLAGAALGSTPLSVAEIPLLQFLAVDVALYCVAASRPRRTGAAALAMALSTLAAYLAVRLLSGWVVGTSAELTVALTAVIAWLLGRATHESRAHAGQLRAQAAAQAVTAERLRIARELHDMVAHTIGIVALQAGAARRVIDTRPELARDALGAVETASRETLSGLRRMLGALRGAAPGEVSATAPPPPSPGLADVNRLAARTTAAGVRVHVRWLGTPGPLPPEVDVSAYRIVQEAVTNVVRHAGTDSCQVTVERRGKELRIEVLDEGRPGGTGGSRGTGYGLLGMRERVSLLHGEFSARPCPGGGFRVAARLPVPEPVR